MGLGYRIVDKVQIKAAPVLVVLGSLFALALTGPVVAHYGLVQGVKGVFREHPGLYRQFAATGSLVISIYKIKMPQPIIGVGTGSRRVQLIRNLGIGIELSISRSQRIVRGFLLEIHQEDKNFQGVLGKSTKAKQQEQTGKNPLLHTIPIYKITGPRV